MFIWMETKQRSWCPKHSASAAHYM